ncbi:unnamed protein product [Camellia sinensis]
MTEIGSGQSVVVFLHGFPEIWYSWRHQMIALSNASYRAIAPDFRGYGLSDPPPEPEKASFADLIIDLLAILDVLSIPKVFLVAKDFGARPAYYFSLFYPERVSGIITMGALFFPPGSVTFGSIDEEFKLPNTIVACPALLIVGEKDYAFKFPGNEDYIRSGTHFVQEQFPDQR